jgi:hypothetical protein
MTLDPGDIFHYIGQNKLCDDDYVILVERDLNDDYYWYMFEIASGKIVYEHYETLMNGESYRKVA